MPRFVRLCALLYRLTAAVGVATFVAMTAVVCLNVILRAGFNSALVWGEEVARFLMVWAALCGAALAVRQGAHFRMDMLTGVWRIWLSRLPAVGALGIGLLLLTRGSILVELAHHQLATGSQLPMSVPYLAMPLCGALMMVFAVEALFTGSEVRPGHAGAAADSAPPN